MSGDGGPSSLGEFELVGRIIERLGDRARGVDVLGPGDDAAVVPAPDRRVVASTDVQVEGRHFRSGWVSAYDVGRRAASASLADIAAMGAEPTALLVGLVATTATGPDWLDGFADGLRDEAARCQALVVGGDLVRGEHVTIAVTALGDLGGRRPVTRSGAQPGDVVAVAGRLGWSAAGLRALDNGSLSGELQDAFRRPAPPYEIGPAVADLGATAMIDVSDGLAADLGHVSRASGVRIDIELAAVRALGTTGVTDDDVLTGGEDHALAFTIDSNVMLSDRCVIIGHVSEGSGVHADGSPVSGGHDHFRS
ncbi:MAG: thiamine-phosphate kinase [Actinomycetes bacterium]